MKGSKYTLLKAEDNLSNKQKQKLKQVKEASPLIGIMHELKEEFRFLFEPSQNLGEGTLELIDWLKKAQPYYKKSVGTIKRWLAEIVGYFEQKTTNGIVERINNKLKLLKRWGFGWRNFINFKIRALLLWHFPNNCAAVSTEKPCADCSHCSCFCGDFCGSTGINCHNFSITPG